MTYSSKLSGAFIRGNLSPGRYTDGDGLVLHVGKTGHKSWVFRYRVNGREREMGLGRYPVIPLREARSEALACRKMRAKGLDPIDERVAKRKRVEQAAVPAMKLHTACDKYIETHEAGWKSDSHGQQWRATLARYVYPSLGDLDVAAIDTACILRVLEPIWYKTPVTASRLRGRLEVVIDWSRASGHRSGENPARWRGHLSQLLPAKNKIRRVRHHPALPFEDIPDFLVALRERPVTRTTLAFELLILTAARAGEIAGARWTEFNLDKRLWTVPAERMKAGCEHRVPLTTAASAIITRRRDLAAPSAYVFRGRHPKVPLASSAFRSVLRGMKRLDITTHGFRSTFRDWVSECTNFPREVAEMALAHTIGNAVEAAYRRGDLLEKRRLLMDAWATYCLSKCAPVCEQNRATDPARIASAAEPLGLAVSL